MEKSAGPRGLLRRLVEDTDLLIQLENAKTREEKQAIVERLGFDTKFTARDVQREVERILKNQDIKADIDWALIHKLDAAIPKRGDGAPRPVEWAAVAAEVLIAAACFAAA
jgi:hypothetical protein